LYFCECDCVCRPSGFCSASDVDASANRPSETEFANICAEQDALQRSVNIEEANNQYNDSNETRRDKTTCISVEFVFLGMMMSCHVM